MRDRLYRSREDVVIGGVAGGVADALDLDPSIVRVVWVVLAFLTGGIAALVYLVMLIVVPQTPVGAEMIDPPATEAGVADPPSGTPGPIASGAPGAPRRRARREGGTGGGLVFGVILVLVGAFFLVREYVPEIDLDLVWPVVVIVIGGLLVLTAMRPGRRTDG
jgi:phage shock protein PspC (stress-responsive transcriptional regulator)